MTKADLPLIIAGPILRHCDIDHFTLWFVSSVQLPQLTLQLNEQQYSLKDEQVHQIQLGQNAWQYLIKISKHNLLIANNKTSYKIIEESRFGDIFADIAGLHYSGEKQIEFIVKTKVDKLFHGSCRNPHHQSDDALVAADKKLTKTLINDRPSHLILSGDQVYVDDIAGPTLYAIGQVIRLLGLPSEHFTNATFKNSEQISYHPAVMYQRRRRLLPYTEYSSKTPLWHLYINHPIFTSSLADNHLVSLGEIIALYLLTWSPELWKLIDIPKNVSGLSRINQQRWQQEWFTIQNFISGLEQVRRLMAHIPTYMIFDDHDITDDWNLTAKWEEAAYNHAFSRRIIGNALIGYTLFQGLGNQPQSFKQCILPLIDDLFKTDTNNHFSSQTQNTLINALLKFENWHYTLDTQPKIIVLDSRTRRWRNESNLAKPSGLMDWEALMELQHELIDQPNVIIVSATPMFGVKLIETIQRVATSLGACLHVDAENWMAHNGTANGLLNIMKHRKTPEQFTILSGDVHYSFAYDVKVRFRQSGPHIHQITCSGIKNQFPGKALPVLDKLNRWLYGYVSPLNLFTKRKRMEIRGRRPNGEPQIRLINQSGIGIVTFSTNGAPQTISILHSNMQETVFEPVA